LEQGTSYSAPAPGGSDPHTTDPTCVRACPVQEAVRRAENVVTFTREEHHVPAGLGDGSRELLPVADGPRRGGGEGFAKGIRGVAKGAQSEVSVEIHLV
jgi:hypothetical protein